MTSTDGISEDPWDEFFSHPSISFTHNTELRELFEAVLDPTENITLVLGAGVSLDAGYPSWNRLISNMAEDLDDRWHALIAADASDPMRKAEYVVRLAMEASRHQTEGQIVSKALYSGTNVGKSSGSIADAIARFAAEMGDRVKIVTTNFDVLVEDKLKLYVEPDKVFSHTLKEWTASPPTPNPGEHHVLHLHGIVETNKEAREHLILTESKFLEHGADVRTEVTKYLTSSRVVFIGVSLTDPNLVGPLWTLKQANTKLKKPFSLIAAAPDSNASNAPDSRAFAIKQATELGHHLDFSPVKVKSYSQIAQVLHELTLAVRIGTYLDPTDLSNRYGNRLQTALDTCYTNVACKPDEDIASGDAGLRLAKRLNEALYGTGGLVEWFRKIAADGLKANNPKMKDLFTRHGPALADENFGLFLWLRSRGAGGHEAEYQLNLVGTSVYTHLEPWSLDRQAEISPISRHAVARAAFSGQTEQENISDGRKFQLWQGMVAVPFTVQGLTNGETIATIDPTAKDEHLDVLAVGGITLNTTHVVDWTDDSEGKRSIISMLTVTADGKLPKRLAEIAETIVSTRLPALPGATTPTL